MEDIVILGGGFGGVYTAHELLKRRDDVTVTLISEHNYFLFVPMLHEVATGNIRVPNVVEPIREILHGESFQFIRSTVESVDFDAKEVSTSDGMVSYDKVVVALGSQTNFYGVDGSENVYTLKSLEDAYRLRNHVIDLHEDSVKQSGEAVKQCMQLVIVGGGPTGVELACELADWTDRLHACYPELETPFSISLLDPNEKVLNGVDERLRDHAMRVLDNKGVDLVMGARATEVEESSVSYIVDDVEESIDSRTVVWTAGVKPVDVPMKGVSRERGRLPIDQALRIEGVDDAFALGDIADYANPDGSRPPVTAQLAYQQAFTAAANVGRAVDGDALEPFVYQNKGFLASLGNHQAIADIHGFRFTGFFAWWLWRTIYLTKLVGLQNKLRVVLDWTFDLFFPRDTSRL